MNKHTNLAKPRLCSHGCGCWWPGTIRSWGMCRHRHDQVKILRQLYNDKTVLLRDTVHQISRGESAAGADLRSRAADSPREIWWTVSHNYTVLFLSRHVKKQNSINIYPSLILSNSIFRKPVMFLRWRHHGVAWLRHSRGAGHNCLLLTTASNVNCWADVANHVTRLWQAGDTENFERRIRG